MFNSCCQDLLVSISTEYPELIGYQGLYHPVKNETTGRGGIETFFCISIFTGDLRACRKPEQTLFKDLGW